MQIEGRTPVCIELGVEGAYRSIAVGQAAADLLLQHRGCGRE